MKSLFIFLSLIPAVALAVPQWGQCGGLQYTGSTQCDPGNICTVLNPYYSQCLFDPSSGVVPYGQCGGTGYSGPTKCSPGTVCTVVNDYFFQCIPTTSVISSTTSKKTSTTTSTTTTSTNTITTTKTTTSTTTTSATVKPTGFVQTSGQRFTLNGSTYTVVGSNAYYLAQWGNADIDQTFSELQAIGATAVRTWGFNDVTSDPGYGAYYQLWTNGVPTFNTGANGIQRFDYVVQSAKAHGIRLIVPLTNNWSDYGGMDVYISQLLAGSTTTPTHDLFYTNPTVIAAYKNYVSEFVGRYVNEPTILAWELANEPRCRGSSGSASASCNTVTVTNWASQISAYIKSIDGNHLVALGDEGFYNIPSAPTYPYQGSEGIDFDANLAVTTLDFGTFHSYPESWGQAANETYWGVQWILDHYASQAKANKPTILEEFGVTVNQTIIYPIWWSSIVSSGLTGDLIWQAGSHYPDGDTWDDGYAVYPDGPVYPLEQEHIAELKARDGTGPPVTSIIHSTTTSVVTSSTTSTRVSTTTTTATTSTVVPTGFVRTSGQKFVLNGSTFTPAGSNAYYLAQWGNADIDQTFTELAAIGVTTVRTWGFNDVTADPGYGAYYQLWTNGVATLNTGANGLQRFDYVITSAKAHGIKLIVPLTNNWSDYGGMDVYISQLNPGGTHDTFYTNAAVIAAYKNYIAGFVGRYANEPTILAWELANEPRCGGSSGSPSSSCKAPTITNWASQISAYIKSIDSNHLVAIGDEGFYDLGAAAPSYVYQGNEGIDFDANLAISTLDFGTFHSYPDSWGETGNESAWGVQWIQDHYTSQVKANKPTILEEYGVTSNQTGIYQLWWQTLISSGITGDLIWQAGSHYPDGDTWDDGFAVYPDGPVYPLQQQHIAALKARDGTGPPVSTITSTTTSTTSRSTTTSTSVSTASHTTSTVIPTGFVTTASQKFILNGKIFTPAGSNAYYLAQWGNADIDQTFTELAAIGVTVVRTWGFNDVTADPGYGAYYQLWTNGVATLNTGANGLQRFDYVITSAKAHGIKLIVPLTNNWSDYGGMDVYISQLNPGGTHDTFYTNSTVISAYKNYIAGFVGRYLNEPTILAWELANEPRCGGSSGSPSSSCKAPTLTNWASQISAYIKSIDPYHLVAIGGFYDLGAAAPSYVYQGNEGVDFDANLAISTLDFGTFHSYPDSWGETGNESAWGVQWIQDHYTSQVKANKPTILEEYGVTSNQTGIYQLWWQTIVSSGLTGDLIWQAGSHYPDGDTWDDGFAVYPDGPVYPLQQQHIAALEARDAGGSSTSSTATSTTSSRTTSSVPPPTGTALRDLAARKGIYIGTALDGPYLSNSTYANIAGSQFSMVTPGNEMKWTSTENTQGVFTFSAGDAIVAFAVANNQRVRGHNLVWNSQVPSWLNTLSATDLLAAMQSHITNVMGHWKGQLYCWDVVNEPFNGDGTYVADFWYNTLGPSYLTSAYTFARAADPGTKLYVNDYNVEGVNAKSTAMLTLATSLHSQGILDGVGLEGHYIVGTLPSDIITNINRFTSIGLEVAITEFDDRIQLPTTTSNLAQQASDYSKIITSCLGATGCVGVSIWGFTDADSWIPGVFSGYGAALPWDENCVPKPAYTAIVTALGGTVSSTSTSTSATTVSTSARTSSSASQTSSSPPPTGTALRDLAARKGIYFGTALDGPYLSNSTYANIAGSQFNMVTPGNEMKWTSTENTQGVFTFSAGDAIVAFAVANNQRVRGHNLVWNSQVPSWLNTLSATDLLAAMQSHITNIMGHWKGQLYCWDVVNEPFNGDGTYVADFWYNTLGPSYLTSAYTFARAADPGTKLYVNDYNVEGVNTKSTAMLTLATSLHSQGILDGVGLEAHYITGTLPSDIVTNINRFTSVGIEVAITEFDDRIQLPETTSNLAEQASDYSKIVTGCLGATGCVGVTIWGFTDGDSWIPGVFSGYGAALPWDQNYALKPAYSAIVTALGGTASSTSYVIPTSSTTSVSTSTSTTTFTSTTTTTTTTTTTSTTSTTSIQSTTSTTSTRNTTSTTPTSTTTSTHSTSSASTTHTTSTSTTSRTTSTTSRTTSATAPTGTALRDLAARKGIYLGTALDQGYLSTTNYANIAGAQFGRVTPGNEMKWTSTENVQGVFTYSAGDAIVAFAVAHNQTIRGHNLVWSSQVPSWLNSLSASALSAAMKSHITNVMGHWKGQLYCWDVVNEPFNGDGTYVADFWYNTLGPGYITDAYTYARAADPGTKLYINDYNIEGVNSKSTAMLTLATSLHSQGILDGVGLEGHYIVNTLPSDITTNINRFHAVGLEVAITEFDDRIQLPTTTTNLAQQASDYSKIIAACLSASGCVGVSIWGFTDADSWVPSTFSGYGAALPWDANYAPKPAYTALVQALS